MQILKLREGVVINPTSHRRIPGQMAGLGGERGVCLASLPPSLLPSSRGGGKLRVEIEVFGRRPPPVPRHFHSSQASDVAFEVGPELLPAARLLLGTCEVCCAMEHGDSLERSPGVGWDLQEASSRSLNFLIFALDAL